MFLTSILLDLKPFVQKLVRNEPGGPFAEREISSQRICGRRFS